MHWLDRWTRRFLTVEGLNSLAGFAGFGNPIGWIVAGCLFVGAIVVGWLVAAQAWAEGVLQPYGTLGYVTVALGIAILVLLVLAAAAKCYALLLGARHAKRIRTHDQTGPVSAPTISENRFDEKSYECMLNFFIDYLMSAANAQLDLQKAILRLAIAGDKIFDLASQGLRGSFFYRSVLGVASQLGGSPSIKPSCEELRTSIYFAEQNYAAFCDQANSLARDAGVSIEDGDLFELWNVWSYKHDALVRAYEPLKRDRNLGKLFRPMRPSRWGEPINRKSP